MPHLVILYTPNIEPLADMDALCAELADTLLTQRDDRGTPVFPPGGVRVLAYPAAHYAVGDGGRAHGFVWLNLRIGAGRSDATKKIAGDALLARARARLAPVFAQMRCGLTVQIDEAPGQVYDGRGGNLHALYQPGGTQTPSP